MDDWMEDDLTENIEEIQEKYALRLNSRAIEVISHQVSEDTPNHGSLLTLKIDLSKSKTKIRIEFLKLLDKYWQGRFA